VDIIGDLIYAAIIGVVGFGAYRALASGPSRTARRVVVGLVAAAIVFSLVVVSWDIVDGTSTSRESFVLFIVGVPLLIAIGAVKIIDSAARTQQQRHT
jgi:hypothetical protein